MRALRRPVLAWLVLATVAPYPAFAQAPRAGVVTSLEGNVTARRAVLPAPVPLKFKDDVFLRDTITTADRSLARMLLGGKAIVTVRERSVMTITEIPGRSVIELDSGKIGLAVARERMQPGEVINVKTPNAIVAVRGTVLVAEVTRASAQAPTPGATGPQPVTNVYMLRGSAEATAVDPATQAPVGTPIVLNVLQAFNVVGGAPPRVIPFTAEQVGQITAGLTPQGVQGMDAANADQVKAQVMTATATVLAAATAGGLVPTESPVVQAALENVGAPEQSVGSAVNASGGSSGAGTNTLADCAGTSSGCLVLAAGSTAVVGGVPVSAGTVLQPPPLPSGTVFPPGTGVIAFEGTSPSALGGTTPLLGGSDATIVLQALSLSGNVDLAAGTTLASFSGTTTEIGTSPLPPVVQIANGPLPFIKDDLESMISGFTLAQQAAFAASLNVLVQQLGPDNFLEVLPGANVVLNGSLLDVSNAAVFAGNRFLDVAGALTAVTFDPLLRFDPSLLVSASDFVRVGPGGQLIVVGPLIAAVDSILEVGGHLLNVTGFVNGVSGFAAAGSASTMLSFQSVDLRLQNNLVRIADGGIVVGVGSVPLVTMNDVDYVAGTGFGNVSGGSLLRMFAQVGQPGAVLGLTGPYIEVFDSFINPTDAPVFNVADGAIISGSSALAFARFVNTALVSANHVFNFDTVTSFTVPGQPTTVGNGQPVDVVLNGPLLAVQDGFVATQNGRGVLRLNNAVTFQQLSPATLIALANTIIDSDGNSILLTSAASQPAPSLTLGGGLVGASGSSLFNGDPTLNTQAFLFVGDSSTVQTTADVALLAFDASLVDSSGPITTVRRSKSAAAPTQMILAGPLLVAVNSAFDTTSLGFANTFGSAGTACCAGFNIEQGAQLSSTTGQYLIQLSGSAFNAGPDAQSGGNFFQVLDNGPVTTEIVAPPSVVLAGGLLSAQSSVVSALFNILTVGRGSLTSSSPNALIQAVNSAIVAGGTNPFGGALTSARLFNQFASNVTGQASAFASAVTLGGPLAALSGSTLAVTADVAGVFNGASFASSTPAALIQLASSSVTAGAGAIAARLLTIAGQGGVGGAAFASVVLNGPVLDSTNSNLALNAGIIGVFTGGVLISGGTGAALASITGGTHQLATLSGSALLQVFGRTTAVAAEVADGVMLTLGTDQSIQTARTLLEIAGTAIAVQKAAQFDHTLYQAMAPIFSGKPGSSLTSSLDALDLNAQAKVTSVGPVIALDNSVLTIASGAAILVNGGSLLRVTGDLASLVNGSQLVSQNGPMIRVQGNSVLNVTGAMVMFGGSGGNLVNVTNNICISICTTIAGIPVAFVNGASPSNIRITNPVRNPTLGTITPSSSAAAVIVVDGANSQVTISGN